MLLIDGVKYELWTPKKEVEEFHPLVKEHYREIFGENSIFIEGNRLQSESGKGSVPDGFVITLSEESQWHIVEMELSTHQLYDHIVNQVGRFINGVKNTATQKKIIEAIYHYIQDNKQRKAKFEEVIGSGEIYKFISDLITKPPVLVIIIEERTRELDEALDLLKYSPIKIVEFRTFRRAGAEAVHAHLFEPLYKPVISTKTELTPPLPPHNELEIDIRPSNIKGRYLRIPGGSRYFFPGFKLSFDLETDIGVFKTWVSYAHGAQVGDPNKGKIIRANFAKWFKAHPELKQGDKVRISIIEPMKKYRLEVVK